MVLDLPDNILQGFKTSFLLALPQRVCLLVVAEEVLHLSEVDVELVEVVLEAGEGYVKVRVL